jgi:hypothetical protein
MAQDESSSLPPASSAGVYKAIIAIGIMGEQEDVARFVALWITDSEKRAHQINDRVFSGSLVLLPLPEAEFDGRVSE